MHSFCGIITEIYNIFIYIFCFHFQVSLLNIVVELKKCCNHPFLFESADHGYGGDSSSKDGSKLERIILSSGKLVILDKLLVRLHETKHRVLIFSQVCWQYNYAVYASLTLNYQDYQLHIMLARLSPCQRGGFL